jgi:hypothetical protein
MLRVLIAASVLIPLSACETSPATPENGHQFVSALGTPFLFAFKVPICVATLALAAPGAALAAIAEPSPNLAQPPLRPILDEGVAYNCGPPYALAP